MAVAASPRPASPHSPREAPQGVPRATVASRLSCSAKSVSRMVESGEFPGPDYMIGRSPRWLESTVLAWLESKGKQSKK